MSSDYASKLRKRSRPSSSGEDVLSSGLPSKVRAISPLKIFSSIMPAKFRPRQKKLEAKPQKARAISRSKEVLAIMPAEPDDISAEKKAMVIATKSPVVSRWKEILEITPPESDAVSSEKKTLPKAVRKTPAVPRSNKTLLTAPSKFDASAIMGNLLNERLKNRTISASKETLSILPDESASVPNQDSPSPSTPTKNLVISSQNLPLTPTKDPAVADTKKVLPLSPSVSQSASAEKDISLSKLSNLSVETIVPAEIDTAIPASESISDESTQRKRGRKPKNKEKTSIEGLKAKKKLKSKEKTPIEDVSWDDYEFNSGDESNAVSMPLAEMVQLSDNIMQLPASSLIKIVNIVEAREPASIVKDENEYVVELPLLEPITIRELQVFTETYLKKDLVKPRGNARAQDTKAKPEPKQKSNRKESKKAVVDSSERNPVNQYKEAFAATLMEEIKEKKKVLEEQIQNFGNSKPAKVVDPVRGALGAKELSKIQTHSALPSVIEEIPDPEAEKRLVAKRREEDKQRRMQDHSMDDGARLAEYCRTMDKYEQSKPPERQENLDIRSKSAVGRPQIFYGDSMFS